MLATEYSEVLPAEASGDGGCPHLPAVWESSHAEQRQEREAVLFGQMPDGVVERTPVRNEQESILHAGMPAVREGVCELWEPGKEVL